MLYGRLGRQDQVAGDVFFQVTRCTIKCSSAGSIVAYGLDQVLGRSSSCCSIEEGDSRDWSVVVKHGGGRRVSRYGILAFGI